MLRLVLVETKENYALFYYYPENKEEYGILEVKGDEIKMKKKTRPK